MPVNRQAYCEMLHEQQKQSQKIKQFAPEPFLYHSGLHQQQDVLLLLLLGFTAVGILCVALLPPTGNYLLSIISFHYHFLSSPVLFKNVNTCFLPFTETPLSRTSLNLISSSKMADRNGLNRPPFWEGCVGIELTAPRVGGVGYELFGLKQFKSKKRKRRKERLISLF